MPRGEVIYRVWEKGRELQELSISFSSLEELFQLCLEHGHGRLVDRINIRGQDEEGRHRELTLAFRSVTVS